MSTVEEIERVIEQLPREDFEKLADWIDQRRERHGNGLPDQKEAPAASKEYPKARRSAGSAMVLRDHSAFLNSYAPTDEGLYDDAATG